MISIYILLQLNLIESKGFLYLFIDGLALDTSGKVGAHMPKKGLDQVFRELLLAHLEDVE